MAGAGELENNWKAIPTPFGKDARYGGGNGTIPENEIAGSNKASWNNGFPETTFQPNNAPSGGDFNTFNNIISGLLMNIQLGQAVNVYNLDYQNAQGGYPQGALIWANETSEDYTTRALFMSLVDNNLTVPSTANTATWKKLLPADTLYPIRTYMGKTLPTYTQLINWTQSVNGSMNWRKQANNYISDFNPNGYYTPIEIPLIDNILNYDEINFIFNAFIDDGAATPDIAISYYPIWKFNLLMSMPNISTLTLGNARNASPLLLSYRSGSTSTFLKISSNYSAHILGILGVTYV